MTLKVEKEFVAKAMERASARAAEVARHPHSIEIARNSRLDMEKYRRAHLARRLEHA